MCTTQVGVLLVRIDKPRKLYGQSRHGAIYHKGLVPAPELVQLAKWPLEGVGARDDAEGGTALAAESDPTHDHPHPT